MANKNRRIVSVIIGIFLMGQMCVIACSDKAEVATTAPPSPTSLVSSATPVVTRTQKPTETDLDQTLEEQSTDTPVVEVLPEETIILWANGAIASSNAADVAYHATQAVGEPNTRVCGDFVTAWQPADEQVEAWIDLVFSPYILPMDILIAQSFYPGQIRQVDVTSLDDEIITIYDAETDEMGDVHDICPVTRYFSTPDVDVLIRAVHIELERMPDEPWTQIDAVGVNGWVAEVLPGMEPTQSWEDDEEVDFYEPRYFSNKNSVAALSFADDTLWAGGDGGLVAWDLDSPDSPTYAAVSSQPANALAYCDWDVPWLFMGGDPGVHAMLLPFDGAEALIHPLEHPDDENYGRVHALACDNQRQQLWVGYLGHVSRYDLASQSWEEWSWQDGLPNDVVRDIAIIDGDVWVTTADGVALFQEGENLKTFGMENSALPCPIVHAVASDEAGTLWMVSSCGLVSFDGNTWRQWRSEEINGGELGNLLMDLVVDEDGTLWLVDAFGSLCQFDPVQTKCINTFNPPSDNFSLDDLVSVSQGRLAAGSMVSGLCVLEGGEWLALQTDDALLSNAVRAIAQTPDGHMWVANGSALQHFPTGQPSVPWDVVALPQNAIAHSLFAANDGLWIGHTRGARFLPYLEEFEVVDIPLLDLPLGYDHTVTAINQDANGLAYLGLSTGLYIWDGSELVFDDLLSEAQRKNKILPPRVNRIYADGDEVWVGTSLGLYKFVDGSRRLAWAESLQNASSFYAQSVGVLAPNPRGGGLLVGIGRELFSFDGQQFALALQLPSEIRSLYIGPYQIWLATANSGLYTLPMDDTDTIYWGLADKNNALPEGYGYQAILMSDAHTLWIASSKHGLIRLTGTYGQ